MSSGKVGWGTKNCFFVALTCVPPLLGLLPRRRAPISTGGAWGGAVKLSRLFVDQKLAEKKISSFLLITDRGWERSWRINYLF